MDEDKAKLFYMSAADAIEYFHYKRQVEALIKENAEELGADSLVFNWDCSEKLKTTVSFSGQSFDFYFDVWNGQKED